MKAISTKRSQGGGCFLFLFCIIFFCAGSAVFFFLSGKPLYQWYDAQSWESVPCVVTASNVATHHSSDSTTYSVNIRYDYVWNERTYHGDQYNFFSGSSSGQSRKEAIVNQYPEGSERTCFVNPENPLEAVLNRDFSYTYLIGCFGLIFVAVALTIPLATMRRRPNESLSVRGQMQPAVTGGAVHTGETLTLHGGNNSLLGCGFMLIFATIWNGIVGAVFFGMLTDGSVARGEIFPLLFLTPFLLVGIGVIALFLYFFLSLFNPRADVTLTPGYVPLGGTSVLGWSFRGSTSRIRKLTISLRGEEKATYRRGTSTTTDTSIFENRVLFETETPGEMSVGEVQFAVPEFTVPSFDAPNNKIVWSIKVHGDIRRWPDVNVDYEFQLSPLPRENAGGPEPAEFREG